MYVDPFVFKLVENETMNNCFIHSAFDDLHNGTVKLKDGWSLAFTHARKTTCDRPKTIAVLEKTGIPVSGSSAGELWKTCTGIPSIRDMKCCVYNCPNPNCNPHLGPDKAQKAGATAHVYGRFQRSGDDIRYMILLLTCSKCNNWRQCLSSLTNHPVEGEDPANTLYTLPGAQLMFIEVSDATVAGKGAAGKGTGKGGNFQGKGKGGESHDEEGEEGGQEKPSEPPPGVNVIAWGAGIN